MTLFATNEKRINASSVVHAVATEANAILSPEILELSEAVSVRWYAVYTSANREKRVGEQLFARNIEYFLPLYESVRRWKDRRVTLQLPLFPGYLFVRLALPDRLRVQQVPGVARLVGFKATPTPLREQEVEGLRRVLAQGIYAEPHPFLTAGRRVRLRSGPLAGMTGILLRRRGYSRVVISVELIQRSIAVDADAMDVEPASKAMGSEKETDASFERRDRLSCSQLGHFGGGQFSDPVCKS